MYRSYRIRGRDRCGAEFSIDDDDVSPHHSPQHSPHHSPRHSPRHSPHSTVSTAVSVASRETWGYPVDTVDQDREDNDRRSSSTAEPTFEIGTRSRTGEIIFDSGRRTQHRARSPVSSPRRSLSPSPSPSSRRHSRSPMPEPSESAQVIAPPTHMACAPLKRSIRNNDEEIARLFKCFTEQDRNQGWNPDRVKQTTVPRSSVPKLAGGFDHSRYAQDQYEPSISSLASHAASDATTVSDPVMPNEAEMRDNVAMQQLFKVIPPKILKFLLLVCEGEGG